jgi:hypothetical protein
MFKEGAHLLLKVALNSGDTSEAGSKAGPYLAEIVKEETRKLVGALIRSSSVFCFDFFSPLDMSMGLFGAHFPSKVALQNENGSEADINLDATPGRVPQATEVVSS